MLRWIRTLNISIYRFYFRIIYSHEYQPNVYNVHVKWNLSISVYRFVLTTACADDDAVNRYFFIFFWQCMRWFSYWIVCYAIQYLYMWMCLLQDVLDLGLLACKVFLIDAKCLLIQIDLASVVAIFLILLLLSLYIVYKSVNFAL